MKVDNNTVGSMDRPKSGPKNSFNWKVYNFTGGDKDRSSSKFFSHGGYRMQIRSYTPNFNFISLYFRLWKGKNDAHLSWPFKGEVTMSLVDQRDNSNAYSRSTQYDSKGDYFKKRFRRPSDSHNHWIYARSIDVSSIMHPARGIFCNDAMVIRYQVTFPN